MSKEDALKPKFEFQDDTEIKMEDVDYDDGEKKGGLGRLIGIAVLITLPVILTVSIFRLNSSGNAKLSIRDLLQQTGSTLGGTTPTPTSSVATSPTPTGKPVKSAPVSQDQLTAFYSAQVNALQLPIGLVGTGNIPLPTVPPEGAYTFTGPTPTPVNTMPTPTPMILGEGSGDENYKVKVIPNTTEFYEVARSPSTKGTMMQVKNVSLNTVLRTRFNDVQKDGRVELNISPGTADDCASHEQLQPGEYCNVRFETVSNAPMGPIATVINAVFDSTDAQGQHIYTVPLGAYGYVGGGVITVQPASNTTGTQSLFNFGLTNPDEVKDYTFNVTFDGYKTPITMQNIFISNLGKLNKGFRFQTLNELCPLTIPTSVATTVAAGTSCDFKLRMQLENNPVLYRDGSLRMYIATNPNVTNGGIRQDFLYSLGN